MDMVRPLPKTMPGQVNPLRIFSRKQREVEGKPEATLAVPKPSRKASLPLKWECPYHKPTLVGWDKSPKVFERTLVKELGNLTP